MPNWQVHLHIAKKLGETLKLNDSELEKFLFGNICPDINNGYIITDVSKIISHDYTHYSDGKGNLNYKLFSDLCDCQIFNNPFLLGYFCHLATDYYWNNNFYEKIEKEKLLDLYTLEELRMYKQREFHIFDNNFAFSSNFYYKNIKEDINKIKRISLVSMDIEKVNSFFEIQNNNYDIENYILYKKEELEENILESIKFIQNYFEDIKKDC